MSTYPGALRAARFGIVLVLVCCGQLAARAGALQSAATGNPLNLLLAASYAALLGRGLLWVAVLRGERLSVAYPVLALAYPLILVLSAVLFGESISAGKIAGSALVVAGVVLVVSVDGHA
jgi:undecaprenyl phosphate-alpha-L-ara4N flippase subunit ArnE